jgi:hypothetical protein
VTLACEPTGHRWRVLGQLATDRDMPFGRPCRDLAQARSSPEGCPSEAVISASPGKPVTQPIGQFGGDALYALGDRNVSAQDLTQLPSEPAQLKAKLLEGYHGCSAVACQDQQVPRDAWLFETASALVTDMPVTPRVRAAAFRVLAELPGVSVHTHARDPLGRAGLAVSMRLPAGNDKPPGHQEVRLLIDPDTWTGLAVESRILTPDVERPRAERGLRIHYSAVQTTEWVDQRPDTSVAR